MMPRIRFGWGSYKSAEFAGRIDSLKQAITDWRPMWKAAVPVFNEAVAANFARGGSRGATWPALTEETLKQKLREGYPRDTMVRTQRLMRAASEFSPSLRAGRDQIVMSEPKRLTLGVALDYGYYHDRPGGVRGKRREFFALSQETFYKLLNELGKVLNERAQKAWSGQVA